MKIFLLFYMCHFAMGLTHCYKTTVFFTFILLTAKSGASRARLAYFQLGLTHAFRYAENNILTHFILCEVTKFGQPIFTEITNVFATCQILKLKCTKINFAWGSASDTARGAYSHPPEPLGGSLPSPREPRLSLAALRSSNWGLSP